MQIYAVTCAQWAGGLYENVKAPQGKDGSATDVMAPAKAALLHQGELSDCAPYEMLALALFFQISSGSYRGAERHLASLATILKRLYTQCGC